MPSISFTCNGLHNDYAHIMITHAHRFHNLEDPTIIIIICICFFSGPELLFANKFTYITTSVCVCMRRTLDATSP